MICNADAAFAHAEGQESKCGLVVGFTHHPRLVKPGRFNLSMITSWQSTTIKRVVRSYRRHKDLLCPKGSSELSGFDIS